MINLAEAGLRSRAEKMAAEAAPYLRRIAAGIVAALLAGTQVLGGLAPFGPAMMAASPTAALPFVLAGAVLGSVGLLPFAASGKYIVACIAALGARAAMARFAPERPRTLPAASSGALALLLAELISQLRLGGGLVQTLSAFAEAALSVGFALLLGLLVRALRRGFAGITGAAGWAALGWGMAGLAALCRFSVGWVSLGIVVLGVGVCCFASSEVEKALLAAVGGGIALVAVDVRLAPFALGAGAGALVASALQSGGRSRVAAGYLIASCTGMLLCRTGGMMLACFVNATLSAVVFLLLPQRWLNRLAGAAAGEKGRVAAASARVALLGNALCEVGETVAEVCRTLPPGAGVGELPDYLTAGLCRSCRQNCDCWVRSGNQMMDGINALRCRVTAGGAVVPELLPVQLTTLCSKPQELCRAVNEYSTERLALRCAASKTDALRTAVTSQLSAVSQALCAVAKELNGPAALRARYRLDVASAEAAADEVSADVVRSFAGAHGQAHVVLCDGMGVGRAAAVDGTMAASLARRLLESGFDAAATVRLVNVALSLPEGEAGATMDILTLDLARGLCRVYKAGGAPTYFVRSGRVGSLSAETLPVGILGEVKASETNLNVGAGDLAVMVSDGMLAAGDTWIQVMLQKLWQKDAKTIADALLEGAVKRRGSRADDMTVAVVRLLPLQEESLI